MEHLEQISRDELDQKPTWLSATDEKTIIEQAKKRKKAPEISRMLQKQGKTVSDEAVRKTLKTHGYYYLTIQKVESNLRPPQDSKTYIRKRNEELRLECGYFH